MKISLEPYQKEALSFLLQNRFGALFIDPGLGKTAVILALIKLLQSMQKIKHILIIAPIRPMYATWPDEIKKWKQFENISFEILHGPKRFEHLQNKTNIHLINPENFNWLIDYCRAQKSWPYDMLIIDESTKFKSSKAKRFKLLKKYISEFKYRYIMTGTPTPNTYLDLFSQMYLVNPEILGKYITHFRNKYFYQTGFQNRIWELMPYMEKKIQKKISPFTYVYNSSADLPEIKTNDIEIIFDKELRAKYDILERQMFLEIDNSNSFFASSAAHAYGMCRQFTSGQIYKEDGGQETIHDLKIKATLDLIAELQDKPLLIAYYYKHELQRLKKLFGKKAVYAESPKHIESIVNNWNTGKTKTLIAQCRSLAHGLNLQKGGNNILWFSLTDSLEDYYQFNRRVHRKGQAGIVVIHRLIVRGTVDVVQKYRLANKDKSQKGLLEAIGKYRKGKGK